MTNTAQSRIRQALRRAISATPPSAQGAAPGFLDQLLPAKARTAMRKVLGGSHPAPQNANKAAPVARKVSPVRTSLLNPVSDRKAIGPGRPKSQQGPFADTWLTLPEAQPDGAGETKSVIDRGQFLARQDRWEDFLAALTEAETNRSHFSNGSAVAELLAFGARRDLVNGLEHALREGCAAEDPITLDGIMALERVRLELSRAPLMTAVVALAHSDFGWAFQTAVRASNIQVSLGARAQAHFDRAAALLQELEATTEDSPLVLHARCAQFSGRPATAHQVAQTYGKLISLAPQNARHMRALGRHLLPRWHGSYEHLETEARKTANRTAKHWGNAGYSWVYFDALALDPGACTDIDLQLFLEGMEDIVDRGIEADVDQEVVNLLAAYCLVTLKTHSTADAAAETYGAIAETAHWLVRNHLRVLHPMVWAHAERGFANNIGVTSLHRFADHGRQTAHAALAGLFADEIQADQRVVFSGEGLKLQMPA